MGAGLLRALRPMSLVVLLVGALFTRTGPARTVPVGADTAVESVTGAGWFGRAACLGCAVGLFGAAGATLGGVLIEAMLYPEAFAACGIICVRAF